MKRKIKRVLCMVLAVITFVCGFGIANVQAVTLPKIETKTGTIDGVTYVEGKVPLIGKEEIIQGIQTTLKNTTESKVNVEVEFIFYDENGTRLDDSTFLFGNMLKRTVTLNPNSSQDIMFSLVGNAQNVTDPDCFVQYSDYKIVYHVLKESQTTQKTSESSKTETTPSKTTASKTTASKTTASKTFKRKSSGNVNGVKIEVAKEKDYIYITNTNEKWYTVTLEYFSYNKKGQKEKAHKTEKYLLGPNDKRWDHMYGTEVKCTVREYHVKELAKKHGKKHGVEYKAGEWFKASNNNRYVGVVFTNTNNYPVEIKCKIENYDSKGKLIKRLIHHDNFGRVFDGNAFETIYLAKGERYIYSDDIFDNQVDYKIPFSVKQLSNKAYQNAIKSIGDKDNNDPEYFWIKDISLDGARKDDWFDSYWFCWQGDDSNNTKYAKDSYAKLFKNKDISVCGLGLRNDDRDVVVTYCANRHVRHSGTSICFYDKDGYFIGYGKTYVYSDDEFDGDYDLLKGEAFETVTDFPKSATGKELQPYSLDVNIRYDNVKNKK